MSLGQDYEPVDVAIVGVGIAVRSGGDAATIDCSRRTAPTVERLNAGRAVTQQFVAEPASLSLGLALWPHSDDPPVVRSLTYHNIGTSPVTGTESIRTSSVWSAKPRR